MGLINGLVCEHELPVPFDDFTEDEETDFAEVKWDELVFYTSSFFDAQTEHYTLSNYSISEDGQFYKNEVELEFLNNKKGEVETKEIDNGIERQDFTGEIFFGTEILGENYDYTIVFRALFYKGDLKELELDEWKKRDNEKRKKLTKELHETLDRENEKAKIPLNRAAFFIRLMLFKFFGFFSWIFFSVFRAITAIQRWIINEDR